MRPYTLFWCGLVSLVGASVTAGDLPPVRTALLVFFIPLIGWIAGLYLADYYDRRLDLIQKPQRPLPSGRITPGEALLVGALFAITGLLLTLLLPLPSIALVIIASILVFCYAKFTKTRGLLGNFNRGTLTIATYLFGVVSIGLPFSSIPMPVWILSLVFFFHDTNSNIIGAIRDVHGDTTGGYKTTPVLYGIRNALIISFILSVIYLIMTLGITSFMHVLQFQGYFLGLFFFGVLILCVMYVILFRSLKKLTRKQALIAHELFVTERIVFASAFLVGIVQSHVVALLVFLVSLILTLLSQHLLRERYELT